MGRHGRTRACLKAARLVSEWLKRLTFGSAAWNAWRREHPDLVITLDHADLNGMILTGIDFARVSLRARHCTRPIS